MVYFRFCFFKRRANALFKFIFVPDFEEFLVKLIVTDNYFKYSTAVPILENVELETTNDYVHYFSFQIDK